MLCWAIFFSPSGQLWKKFGESAGGKLLLRGVPESTCAYPLHFALLVDPVSFLH